MQRLDFTLLGTGSSGGVPRLGNDWGACDPAEPRNHRLRCSALVEVFAADSERPTRVLIDTSPDLRAQLLAAGADHLDAVLMTHDHADQVGGFDDLRVFAIRARQRVPVYLDAPTYRSLSRRFRYCFEGEHGYPAIVERRKPFLTPGTPVSLSGEGGEVSVLPLAQDHGAIRSLGFRIGSLAYCNDVKHLSETTLARLGGLDVLIIDALRYSPHPTHASVSEALAWVEQLTPARTILTNLHVDLDYQTLKRELPEHVEPGYDGMKLSISL